MLPRLRLVAIGLAVTVLLAACGDEPRVDPLQGIKARGKLVVALEAEFKPFEYVDTDGSIVGFDVDLARALAQDLGVALELKNVKWEAIVPELVSGRADLIASGMTITPERQRTVLFSEPYFHTFTCLLVAASRKSEVRSIEDLNRPDRVVAVKEGTTGDEAARKRCPKAKILSLKTENAAALEVAEGRADAFLYDLASVREHHRQHPETTFLIEEPVSWEPYALAFRLDEPALKAWADRVLAALRKDGRLQQIMDRHRPAGSLEPR